MVITARNSTYSMIIVVQNSSRILCVQTFFSAMYFRISIPADRSCLVLQIACSAVAFHTKMSPLYIPGAVRDDVLEHIRKMQKSDRNENIQRLLHRLSEYLHIGLLRSRPDIFWNHHQNSLLY
ncbi:unnamed protein product [Albugo candida]|uniref:Uncharacterized protein n=1 Tax=Albugo candida TaxID=65357 RepID=A0A024FTN6_9STRA|nr:unnamed protein product [Albugo candida]|eukprot:CCI10411.1 unnamed protein product [Albugo candida]